tara:strand:+ start:6799 stop:8133 length:1335 start_codon:yes stop_codon:yes gene_type:complete
MSDVLSTATGGAVGGIALGNDRRLYNFGERVAELAPQHSPFFVYLSKVAKKATDDPVFKFMEQRHQWQRRNFIFDGAADESPVGDNGVFTVLKTELKCFYDSSGKVVTAAVAAPFILAGQIVALETDIDGAGAVSVCNYKVTETATEWLLSWVGGKDITAAASILDLSAVPKGQVIGSAHLEGSGAPKGWEDSLSNSEGYCQIFKTACNMFSGTAMATRYRGVADEFKRTWTEKLMEHKMDLEQGFLYGIGSAGGSTALLDDSGQRYTHGIVPYTEANGKVYNFSYSSSGYDAFLDAMEDFFALESGNSGNKLVLASRKIITYLNKLGGGSFMNNTVGSSQYKLDINTIPGTFGHQVTMVNTIFGNLHFVAEPLLRGPWEDYAVAVDMKNVAYRPLVGNGTSRDTFIETNIQGNDEDGRRDQIITEAGLEISLPETHAILKFGA